MTDTEARQAVGGEALVIYPQLRGDDLAVWERGFHRGQINQQVEIARLNRESDDLYRLAFNAGLSVSSPPPLDLPATDGIALVRLLAATWAKASRAFGGMTERQHAIWADGFGYGCAVPSVRLAEARHTRDRLALALAGGRPHVHTGRTWEQVKADRSELQRSRVEETQADALSRASAVHPRVADAHAAARYLRAPETASDMSEVLAGHLEATAAHWAAWPAAEPSPRDLSAIALVRAILRRSQA